MNKVTLSSLSIMITTLTINANIFEAIQVDGYLRSAYEIHAVEGDDTFKDGAIGGKVHIETPPLTISQLNIHFKERLKDALDLV